MSDARRGNRIADVTDVVAGALHVVRVTDDGGAWGIGQSACWSSPEAVQAVVRRFAAELVGMDPSRIEHVWQLVHRAAPFRSAVHAAALSALDAALWDLRARRLGVPLHDLLGGAYRAPLRLLCLLWGASAAPDLATAAARAAEQGFTAVKVDPLPDGHADRSLPALVRDVGTTARAVRAAVGDEVDIVFELHRGLDTTTAPAVLEVLAEVQPLWVEDPLPIDSTASQADLARTASVPVAHGERLHSHWEVRELLERGGPQWIRVDVGLAGGVTGARRAAAVADAFASRVVFHNWLGPVLTATTAHLTAALPNAPLLEWWPPVEDGLAAPFLTAAHRREGGWLRLADVPGHGAEADLDRPTPVDVAGPGRLTQPLRRDGSVARSP